MFHSISPRFLKIGHKVHTHWRRTRSQSTIVSHREVLATPANSLVFFVVQVTNRSLVKSVVARFVRGSIDSEIGVPSGDGEVPRNAILKSTRRIKTFICDNNFTYFYAYTMLRRHKIAAFSGGHSSSTSVCTCIKPWQRRETNKKGKLFKNLNSSLFQN